MIVRLSKTQYEIARGYGRLREEANQKLKTRDNKTRGFDGQSIHVLGVAGEYAVSIATGIEWTGRYAPPSKLKEWLSKPRPDLGNSVEVRTRSKSWHQLLVHKNDPPEWAYVLVRSMGRRRFDVVGWQTGSEVKRDDLWNPHLPYPAYAYPTAWLRPMNELQA